MTKHFLEKAIYEYTASIKKPDEKLLDECLANIKAAILDKFHTKQDKEWRLRMSNIGRDTRQLMLEKEYGKVETSPEFLLKMLTGDFQEQILVYILKSAGVELEHGGEVSIVVNDIKIDGTWDIKIKYDNKIYDVKTASEWSFKNKFINYATLAEDDIFGYVDQLIGYCAGEGCEPGGWLVVNKSSGQFKVIEFPKKLEEVKDKFFHRIAAKIKQIYSGEMPPCRGVIHETYYQKPTGNKIIDPRGPCAFCDHKQKCHPTARLEPSRVSKAKDRPMVWYV